MSGMAMRFADGGRNRLRPMTTIDFALLRPLLASGTRSYSFDSERRTVPILDTTGPSMAV